MRWGAVARRGAKERHVAAPAGGPARGQPLVERHLAWARELSPTNALNASIAHARHLDGAVLGVTARGVRARRGRSRVEGRRRSARSPASRCGGSAISRRMGSTPPSMAGRSLPRRPPAARWGPWPEGEVRLRLGATGRRRPGCGQASTRGEIRRFPGGLAALTRAHQRRGERFPRPLRRRRELRLAPRARLPSGTVGVTVRSRPRRRRGQHRSADPAAS